MAVSHSEFWQRYFYKVHRLEQVGQAGGLPGGAFPRKTEIWAAFLESVMPKCLGEERDWGCEQLLTWNSLQDEARREALKQRAEQSMHQEEPGWEEDEGGSGFGALGGFVENSSSSSLPQITRGSEGAAPISALCDQ